MGRGSNTHLVGEHQPAGGQPQAQPLEACDLSPQPLVPLRGVMVGVGCQSTVRTCRFPAATNGIITGYKSRPGMFTEASSCRNNII